MIMIAQNRFRTLRAKSLAIAVATLMLVISCATPRAKLEPEFVETEIGPALKGVRGGPVTVANITNRKQPRYPEDLRRERIQGVVTLEVLIDASGKLIRVTPIAAPHEGFVQPALDAVKQWHFSPPTLEGRAVALLGQVSVHFVLR